MDPDKVALGDGARGRGLPRKLAAVPPGEAPLICTNAPSLSPAGRGRRRPRARCHLDPLMHRRSSRSPLSLAHLSLLGAWQTNGHNCDDGRATVSGPALPQEQGHGKPGDQDAGPSWSGEEAAGG